MSLEVIDNHSVYVPTLCNKPVLDVGCRGFRFSQEFIKRGHHVIAMDPASDIVPPKDARLTFLRLALVAHPGKYYVTDLPDKEANRVVSARGDTPCEPEAVDGISIAQLMERWKLSDFDLIKLNCEGAEYAILNNWPGPIARQIVASFHEHVAEARQGDELINALITRLSGWYTPVQHVKDARYCAGENWWDTVLVRKDLVR